MQLTAREWIHTVIRCADKRVLEIAAIPMIKKLSHLPIVADALRTRAAGSDTIAPMTPVAMTAVPRAANRLPVDHVLQKAIFHFAHSLGFDPFKEWVGPLTGIAAAAFGNVA